MWYADFPVGATNKVVTIDSGLNAGTSIVNDGWNPADPYAQPLARSRIVIPNYRYYDEWDDYVFNPDNYPGMQWHPDGFPLRAGYRTVVDYMGELRYLAQTYPNITKLSIVGYSNGIKDDVVRLDGTANDNVDPNITVVNIGMCANDKWKR